MQFIERIEGDKDKFVSHYELVPEGVADLKMHIGEDVEITQRREQWINLGPDSEEDHDVAHTHVYGILQEVTARSLVLTVRAGEVKYDDSSVGSLSSGELEVLFRRHQFSLKRHAEILELDSLIVGDKIIGGTVQVIQRIAS